MLRDERQSKILEIIEEVEIATQEELCDELNKRNYSVTQATISRDIKQLHLFKINGTQKKYRYAYLKENEEIPVSGKVYHLFRDSVTSVKNACNMVVVKTLTANAAHIASMLDDLGFEEILGTIAGNNTFFIACESDESAEKLTEKLQKILK